MTIFADSDQVPRWISVSAGQLDLKQGRKRRVEEGRGGVRLKGELIA